MSLDDIATPSLFGSTFSRFDSRRFTADVHLKSLIADVPFSYFLCYEDIPNADAGGNGVSHGNAVRMWSIGKWVQVTPDTDDIYDW